MNRTKVYGFVVIGLIVVMGIVMYLSEFSNIVEQPQFMFVSGTEYNIGEAGQIIVEARYADGSSAFNITSMSLNMSVIISFGNMSVNFTNITGFPSACRIKSWYPDKSLFLDVLSNQSSSGNEYTEFTVPAVTGIHEYQAICNLDGVRIGVISKSFHVSEFQNETLSSIRRPRADVTK